MASRLSVTVSMAEDISGMLSDDLARQPRRGVRLGRHDVGRAGFEQNIVEGEPFANLHEEPPFCGAGIDQGGGGANR